ncbi:MAG: hypothetical protein GXY98_01075 [Erysipelothrix sp.]|nr:hypothetical protein [Erysipelothrix sp.]
MKKTTSILLLLLLILSSCNKSEEFRVIDGITLDEKQYDIVTKDYCYVESEDKPGVRGPRNLKIEKDVEFYGVINCETKRFTQLLQYEPNNTVRKFYLKQK